MQDEGIATSLIGRHDTRLPGIYAIETDAAGERSFRYTRESSAARTLFSGIGAALQDLPGFDVIYTSGITLAILPAGQRDALIAMAAQVKVPARSWFSTPSARSFLRDVGKHHHRVAVL